MPLLDEFYSADLTLGGADHRQHAIECHFDNKISLGKELLWVGFPEELADVFEGIYELTQPDVPEYYSYEYHTNFYPAEQAAILENRALEVVKRFENLPTNIGS